MEDEHSPSLRERKTLTEPVAAIFSEWWGDGGLGGAPSGVQRQSPSSGSVAPEAEKKLNFDNTKPL